MKIKIIDNLNYQTFPQTEDMIEIDKKILNEIGKTKQFDENGNIIDYVDFSERLTELTNWFDSYFDKQLNQSLWQDDFTISPDPYFKDDSGNPKTYATIDDLKKQAKVVRNEIKKLRKKYVIIY